MRRVALVIFLCLLPAISVASTLRGTDWSADGAEALPHVLAIPSSLRPVARKDVLPAMRWPSGKGAMWSRAALSALRGHAKLLPRTVPRDIDAWCPAYRGAGTRAREAFWVGLLSALSKHESTYRPAAVGGGGRWYGLLQIAPGTARSYGCRAGSGEALKHGPSNLSCALRIMAVTVPRDGVVAEGMRGVAADWGPFHNRSKRRDMIAWTRSQSYCQDISSTIPRPRQ